ncbi:MAG: hypothetical protein GC160_18595 [Acidobacteria bacterium]|nr:hypothetical protein [Acidobacteriota bacterium]
MLFRVLLCFLLAITAPCAAFAQSCLVETIAGDFQGPPPGDGGPTALAELVAPVDVGVGPDGAVYISDPGHRVIRRVGSDGIIRTFAGTGQRGFSGDGGPAAEAVLSQPGPIAFGPDGSLYFADERRIRRVATDGIIQTVAGNGSVGVIESGALATETSLSLHTGLAVDSRGILYLSTGFGHQVFRIGLDGRISLFAGRNHAGLPGPFFSGDGGPAAEALLYNPGALVTDSSNVVYILDRENDRIRTVDADGMIDTFVGGTFGQSPVGTPREEIALANVNALAIDDQDRLYWPEYEAIRRLPLDGVLETAALLPDRRTASNLTVGPSAQIFYIDWSQLFVVPDGGALELFAGSGLTGARGDGGPARNAVVGSIEGIAAGPDGAVYYADGSFFRIRKIGPDGVMQRVAGTGDYADPSDEGMPALVAGAQPSGVALDAQARVLYTERRDRVWRIESDGTLYRVAGQGLSASRCPGRDANCGDGGPARDATIPQTEGVVADSLGNIYVGERLKASPIQRVRRIRPDGMIESLPIRDPSGNFYDDVTAFATTLDDELLVIFGINSNADLWAFPPDGRREYPRPGWAGFFSASVAVVQHPNGDVYAPDYARQRLYRLDAAGRRHSVAAVFPSTDAGAGNASSDGLFGAITSLAVTTDGDLLIGDDGDKLLRRIRNVADCPADDGPQIALHGLLNGASFQTAAAPGAIFSVFGQGLGPEQIETAQLSGGSFPTEIAGTRVLINGEPAPLIFVAEGQIGGIVPWNAPVWRSLNLSPTQPFGPLVDLVVERDGIRSAPTPTSLNEASPAFFTADSSGTGLAAALNQDGSVNSPLNPAPLGSIIVLFGTGFGPFESPQVDGRITQSSLAPLVYEPKVMVGNQEAELLYAGQAPGLVSGVVQLNILLPAAIGSQGAIDVSATVEDQKALKVQVVVGQ